MENSVLSEYEIKKHSENDKIIALAGNPNVGKSSVFNLLTGMKQHTGNWPGKTVSSAQGYCRSEKSGYVLVDLPGTYSLMSHSPEEEVARNFICFAEPDVTVAVCDATCLKRSLNLVLQIMEFSPKTLVCVNLMDEAERKNIRIDLGMLSKKLGVPVVGVSARRKKSMETLISALDELVEAENAQAGIKIEYPQNITSAALRIENELAEYNLSGFNLHWLSLRLLEGDSGLLEELCGHISENKAERLSFVCNEARAELEKAGISSDRIKDIAVSVILQTAEDICEGCVVYKSDGSGYSRADRTLDRIFTGKATAFPIMLLMLAGIVWLTVVFANYPSSLLSEFLLSFQYPIFNFLDFVGMPAQLCNMTAFGIYRVLAWVVSVMLPPMAIFFPLFTLLEDLGYLPRVAYNLDKPFKKCAACGKQSLTMCMGLGCNAAGVVGCRIIDSKRERLLAILTNSFMPCNGKFPALTAIITMFLTFGCGAYSSLISAVIMTAIIAAGVFMTMAATKLLSKTVLRGMPSSFALEMPPYRPPQVGRVIVRSVLDRTIFVLGRAAAVAAPCGMVIWLMANLQIGGASILAHVTEFLDPFAQLMGLDGVILTAFILGFPANEIVIPIAIMAYSAAGAITELDSLSQMRELFAANGWTVQTAISTMLFSLMHWPCSTTLITVKKETGSIKWTLLAALVPTAFGIAACILLNLAIKAFQFM